MQLIIMHLSRKIQSKTNKQEKDEVKMQPETVNFQFYQPATQFSPHDPRPTTIQTASESGTCSTLKEKGKKSNIS